MGHIPSLCSHMTCLGTTVDACLHAWWVPTHCLDLLCAGLESQDSIRVPHSALLAGQVSNTGTACSHLAWRHTKAGGNVHPPLCSLPNHCRLCGGCKTPTGPFFKLYLWASFRNICSVIYSVFPNLCNKISVCPITQFLLMSVLHTGTA